MKALDALSRVMRTWDDFLNAYAVVEPGAAFDLRGDPPQYIRDIEQQIIELCDGAGIEIDPPPPMPRT